MSTMKSASDVHHCPRLSVALIVRDAEDCLAETLDSVCELADEIVVLDTGSRDSTVRIARQKATNVVSRAWRNDFADARNAALTAVTGDWVLWLDAGETISAATAASLRKFIDHDADDAAAYFLTVRTPAQGMNIAGEQIARLRLHRKQESLQFAGVVRESLLPAALASNIRCEILPFAIERSEREHDPALKQARARRNLQLAREAIAAQGATAALWNCIGEAAQALGDASASIEQYKNALNLSTPHSSDMLEAYYGMLTALEGDVGSREAQLQLCLKALESFPLDAQLLCAIGGYIQSKGDLELASRAYELAANHGQMNLEVWHLDSVYEIALHCYTVTLQLLGREDEAIALLAAAIEKQPDSMRLRRQLLDHYVRHGQRDEALEIVNKMPRHVPNREAFRSAVRGACLAAEGNWVNGKTYLETAYKAGCRETVCLRWLTATYLAAGSGDDAGSVLEQWSQLDPLNGEIRQFRQELRQFADAGARQQIRLDRSLSAAPIPAPLAAANLAIRTGAETR